MWPDCTLHPLDNIARLLQLLEVNICPLGGLLQGEHDVLLAELDDLLQRGVAEALPVPLPDTLLRLAHALAEQGLVGDAFLSHIVGNIYFPKKGEKSYLHVVKVLICCCCAENKDIKNRPRIFVHFIFLARSDVVERYMPRSHADLKAMKSFEQLSVAALLC